MTKIAEQNETSREAYRENEPYVMIIRDPADDEAVMPIVDRLVQKGCRVWYDKGASSSKKSDTVAVRLAGAFCVLNFITASYVSSPECRRELTFAQNKRKPIIDIYLEKAELSPGMEMQLGLDKAIYKFELTEAKFFRELFACKELEICKKGHVLTAYERSTLTNHSSGDYTPTFSNGLPGAIMLAYGAIAPLLMHFASKNYENFWRFILDTTLPLVLFTVLVCIIGRLICVRSIRFRYADILGCMLISGALGALIALIASPFFVHSTELIILKILIPLGVNIPSTFISAIVITAALPKSFKEQSQ